jgi:hypothetical protein
MLGVATNIQRTAAQLQGSGTLLLLQIDSDTSVHEEFMFCDMGAAQFWIEAADLAKGRFDKAWAPLRMAEVGLPANSRLQNMVLLRAHCMFACTAARIREGAGERRKPH